MKSFSKNVKERVFNEVKIVHELRHQNILGFHNWYETKNHYWIIFEYCSGGDLRSVIEKDKFVIEPVLRNFARDLVSALSYLHWNGTVFCDLKPGNILLNEYSVLKLCDFGLSQQIVNMVPGSEAGQQNRQGTPHYMAPELFDQKGVFSFASDIYSVGAVLYELACGRPPFIDESFTELAKNICEASPRPLTTVSIECNEFIMSLLEKNPTKRPKWKQIMAHKWWQGVRFVEYEYSEEVHFDKYIQEKNLSLKTKHEEIPIAHQPAPSEIRPSTPTGTNGSKKLIKESKQENITTANFASTGGHINELNDEQILRLSLNIKKNINREKGEYLDTLDDHQDVKLDKYMTVNMGATVPAADHVEEPEATKSQETVKDRERDKENENIKIKNSAANLKSQKSGMSGE